MAPNVLKTEGYFNLGFPSPPPALPPPPPAPEIKPTGPRRGGSPPCPPARIHGSCVRIIFRVEREQPGHKLRHLGNVLWRKEAGDPLAFPVCSRLAATSQWRSLSLGVSVCASPVPSACCQCCVTVVCALQRTDGRVARVPGGWAGAGVGAWLHWAARFADLRVTLARVVARPLDCLFHLHTSHLRVFPPHNL